MRHPVIHRQRQAEDGAVAVMVALMTVGLVIVAAMTLDFGAARQDRQMNKSSADAAAHAGVRGLDRGDNKAHPFSGVCQALDYLRRSQPDMAGLPLSGGNVNCPASAADLAADCTVASAHYWGAVGNVRVDIKSPYLVSEAHPITGAPFPEESLDSLQSDTGDPTRNGCDQIAVIISETKEPGLGKLATSDDLVTTVRTVGRLTYDDLGQGAVALLLLERNDCEVLNAGGTASILVKGNGAQPGMIHVDSLGNNQVDIDGNGVTDGTGRCNSVQVINGSHANSIVATQSETTPIKPAIISVRALSNDPAADPSKATDPSPKVVVQPDPPNAPIGRGLLTRAPVDDRWLGGVRAVVNSATNYAKASVPLPAAGSGVTYESTCTGATGPSAATLSETDTVIFDCGDAGKNYPAVTLNARRVIFRSNVYLTNEFRMPNAEEVYVRGIAGGDAITVGPTSSFQMHTAGRTIDPPPAPYTRPICTGANMSGRARLVIGAGSINASASTGHMQMCHTTTIMMGNQAGACLPATSGTPPTINTCDSFINISGGRLDWTAPDAVGSGAVQSDWDQLEDLALWSEAEDTSNSTKHRIVGGGGMRLAGVFMIPNGNDVIIGGTGDQVVDNSQYVVRRLTVGGTGVMTLRPDPADSFTVPIIGGYEMVR